MDYTSLRRLIRATLEESSRPRRAATRGALTAARDDDTFQSPPVTPTGRVDTLEQIAQLGYNLAGESAGGLVKYGFTMTSIQKVGINPASGFETPLALYAYLADPVHIDQLLGGKLRDVGRQIPEIASAIPSGDTPTRLPFVASAPYISFFRINDTPGVYYTSVGMDASSYKDAIDNLYMQFTGKSGVPNAEKNFRIALVKAQQHNKVSTGITINPAESLSDYGRLATIWSLTRAMSLLKSASDFDKFHAAGADKSKPIDQSNISMWRTLLLAAGVKALVDDAGKGLIHRFEPTQMAVMDTTILEIIQQFDNVTPGISDTRPAPGRLQRERTRLTTKMIESMSSELAKKDRNVDDMLYYMRTLSLYPAEARRQLKAAGVFDALQEFIRNFIKNRNVLAMFASMSDLHSAYKIFGDVIISDIIDSIAASSTPYEVISDIIQNKTTTTFLFTLKLFKAFAAKHSTEIAAKQNFYSKNIIEFANAVKYENTLKMSEFIQEVMPIIKLMPDGKNTVMHGEGSQVKLIDEIRAVFGEAEQAIQAAATDRKESQIRQKYTRKPNIEDVLAQTNPAESVLKLVQSNVRIARARFKWAYSIHKDNVLANTTSLLQANADSFLTGPTFLTISNFSQMLPGNEGNIKLEEIYQRYKAAIHAAMRPITQDQVDAAAADAGTNDEVSARSKKLLQDHTAMQLQKILAAINTFEREMTDFLTTFHEPASDEPLYERILMRLL